MCEVIVLTSTILISVYHLEMDKLVHNNDATHLVFFPLIFYNKRYFINLLVELDKWLSMLPCSSSFQVTIT